MIARKGSILVEGPDGVGKTTISRALGERLGLPVFKFPDEAKVFRTGQDGWLKFDLGLTYFLDQTDQHFISDRSYVSEFVYAHAFDRDTNWDMIERIDEMHSRLGTTILYLYSSVQPAEIDELVPPEKYWHVKSWYDKFCNWTSCRVIKFDTEPNSQLDSVSRLLGDVEGCLKLL